MSYNIIELLQESNNDHNKSFNESSLIMSFVIPEIKDITVFYARNSLKSFVDLIIDKELYGLKKFVYAVSNNSNVELYHKYINTHQLPDIKLKGYEYFHLNNSMYIDKAMLIYIEHIEIVLDRVYDLMSDNTDDNVKIIKLREIEEGYLNGYLIEKLKRGKLIKYKDFGFPHNIESPDEYFKDKNEKTIIYDKDQLEKIYRRLKFAKSHYNPLINKYKNDLTNYYNRMDSIYCSLINLSKNAADDDVTNQINLIANDILKANKDTIMIVESVIRSQVTNIRDSIIQDLNVCGYINENFNKKGE